MLYSKSKILVIATLTICALSTVSWAKTDWDAQAAKRKAEYVFLEAQNAVALERYDQFQQLTDYAFWLDTNDIEMAAEWANMHLSFDDLDSIDTERAYSYLKRSFLTNHDNYISSRFFAGAASSLGRFDDCVRAWEIIDSLYPSYQTPALQLAQAYLVKYLKGDSAAYPRAIAIYDKLEQGMGKNLNLASQKIRAFVIKGDTTSIVNEIEAIASSAPGDSYAALFVGSNYEYLNDTVNALKYYDLSCQLDSANGNAYMARANLYKSIGDSIAFDREVFKALQSHNLEVETKVDMLRSYVSMLYTDSLQEPRIRQLFSTLETQHPGEPDIYQLYYAYLYEIADYAGAAEQMSYCVALDPSNENARASLVQAYALSNDQHKALSIARESMEKFPDNIFFPMSAALGLRLLGDSIGARNLLDSVTIDQIYNPDAVASFYTYRADYRALAGDTIGAIAGYEEAIAVNPAEYMALNNAAYFMALNDMDLDKAESYILRVIRANPDNPTYLDTAAWVYFKKKDYPLAKEYIDKTIQAVKETQEAPTEGEDADDSETDLSVDILEHAGDIYFMNGEPDEALAFWKRALKLDPNNEMLKKKVKHKTFFFK